MNGKDEFATENVASVDLVPVSQDRFLNTIPENYNKAIEKISNVTKVIDGAVRMALGRTYPQDWVKMGDKYYLQASGVEKIRSVFGLYFRDRQITREDLPDGSYAYICTGVAGSKLLDSLYGETTIEIEGSRSSNDSFFGSQKSIVDPMDVRKSAYANFQMRAAKALLGLGNFTAEDLKAMGVDVNRVGAVEYKKEVTEDDKKHQHELLDLLIQLAGTNKPEVLEQRLEDLTTFKGKDGKTVPGIRSLKALTGKRLDITLGKAKDAVESLLKLSPEEQFDKGGDQ